MAGENDGNLEWPMRGIFSVELLNQEQDHNHKQLSVYFDTIEAKTYNSKVNKGHGSVGYGIPDLIKHQELERKSIPSQIQYLKDDTLYFQATMTRKLSSSKPWLAGALS